MVTDHQYRRLIKLVNTEKTQAIAVVKPGMDVKTARKYIKACRLPGEIKKSHTWRTREGWPGLTWCDAYAGSILHQVHTGE